MDLQTVRLYYLFGIALSNQQLVARGLIFKKCLSVITHYLIQKVLCDLGIYT